MSRRGRPPPRQAKPQKNNGPAIPTGNIIHYQIGLLTLLGSCSCIAGIICLIAIVTPWGLVDSVAGAIIGILSATFTSLFVKLFSKSIAQIKGLLLLVCSCLLSSVMSLAIALLILDIAPFQATLVMVTCGGSAGILLFLFWFPRICSVPESSHSLRYLSRVSLSSFALATPLIFFLPLFLPVFTTILFVVSLICGLYGFAKYEKKRFFEDQHAIDHHVRTQPFSNWHLLRHDGNAPRSSDDPCCPSAWRDDFVR